MLINKHPSVFKPAGQWSDHQQTMSQVIVAKKFNTHTAFDQDFSLSCYQYSNQNKSYFIFVFRL